MDNDFRQRLIDAGATPAEADAKLGLKKKSKYHATRTEYNGWIYDSKGEANRAAELDLLVKSSCGGHGGVIRWIPQVPFYLGCRANKYVVDFLVWTYEDCAGASMGEATHAEDFKGFETQKFLRDLRLWRQFGKFPLHVVTGKGTKIIIPENSQ
jgi:hypothetical protein